MKEAIMNQEKLAKLQAQVRIGGKVKQINQEIKASSQVAGHLSSYDTSYYFKTLSEISRLKDA